MVVAVVAVAETIAADETTAVSPRDDRDLAASCSVDTFVDTVEGPSYIAVRPCTAADASALPLDRTTGILPSEVGLPSWDERP